MAVPLTFHPLRAEGEQAVEEALKLTRQSAYDAAYLVLGTRLGAPLWTFDGPLARNARAHGHPVHLVA